MNAARFQTSSEKDHSVAAEEVLLQITLAFMVFLGFLVSDEVVNKTALGQELYAIEKGLRLIIDTPKQDMIRQLNQALSSEQKYKLLEAWWKIRSKLRLFQLTALFEDNNSPLYEASIDELRTSSLFKSLHVISNNFFNDRSGKNLDTQINELVSAITGVPMEQSAFNLTRHRENSLSGQYQKAGEVSDFERLSEGVPHPKNIAILRQEIHKDFQDQKQKVCDIQYRAVTRLLDEGIANWSHFEKETEDPHIIDLDKVIEEWNKELPLLLDVKKAFEHTTSKSSSSG